jgi:hypothetical protein
MEWSQIKDEILNFRAALDEISYGEFYSKIFFKTREIIQKYFADTQ